MRNKTEVIYKKDRFSIFKNKNKTFSIEGVINRKRIRKRAKTFIEAKSLCYLNEEEIKDENVVRTSLSRLQLREAERAYEIIPSNVNLLEILRYFNDNDNSSKASLDDIIKAYLLTKEQKRPETYKDVKNKLNRFLLWAKDKEVHIVDKTLAKQFLESVPPGSFNHFNRHCKALFNWAMKNDYVKSNPFEHIPLKAFMRKEVSILSVNEAKGLLEASMKLFEGELLAYTVITLFAGLRPQSEMESLTWSQINLEDAEIRVVAGKTNVPRTIDLSGNCVQWLRVCNKAKPIYPKNFRRKWDKIRNHAGFTSRLSNKEGHKRWVKDITRHTAISYKIRKSQDIYLTATWAGNSPRIIRNHYLGIVASNEAKQFWEIVPE
jgi:site-specific recombinase XerD